MGSGKNLKEKKKVSLRRCSPRPRRGASRGGYNQIPEKRCLQKAYKAEHPIFNFPFILLNF